MAKFTQSSKGKVQLIHDGYTFIKLGSGANNKTIWRCTEWKPSSDKCLGRCHTINDAVTWHSANHNHQPNIASIAKKVFMQQLKAQACQTTNSPAAIIATASRNLGDDVVASLPKVSSLKKTIGRKRNQVMRNINPKTLDELEIPEEFKNTEKNERFFAFDSGKGTPRVIIFSTEQNLNFLKKSSHWYSDGTFKSAPPLFNQFFIIHGKYDESCLIPLVYCLMSHRTTEAYYLVFDYLAEKLGDYDPDTMMSDFEIASRISFQKNFPNTYQRGCFFHFMQAIWKHIQQDKEILQLYKNDTYFAFHLRYLPALAFLPKKEVIPAFEKILELPFFVSNKKLLSNFVAYFEATWIGQKKKARRLSPTFPIELWNVNKAVSEEWDKTNNGCEGFNRGFSSLLAAHHQTIWKFINCLKDKQTLSEMTMTKLIAGDAQPPRKRPKFVSRAAQLKNVVDDFENRDLEGFLKGIVCNICF